MSCFCIQKKKRLVLEVTSASEKSGLAVGTTKKLPCAIGSHVEEEGLKLPQVSPVELEVEPFFIESHKAPQGSMITKRGRQANVFLYKTNTLLYDREWTIMRKGDTVRLCTLSYEFLMEFTIKLA